MQNVNLLSVDLALRIATTGLYRQTSVIKTSQLMMYKNLIVVCSQIHTKQNITMCGWNVILLSVILAVHIVTAWLCRANTLL